MEKEIETVSLANLGRGAVIEQFDVELSRVLENILDPNTAPAKIREITLAIKIKPNDNRDFCAVTVESSAKLASSVPFKTQMFVGRDAHGIIATEYNPQQIRLGFDQPHPGERLAAAIAKGEKEE